MPPADFESIGRLTDDERELYKALGQVVKAIDTICTSSMTSTTSAVIMLPGDKVWRRVSVTIEEVKPQ